MNFGCDSVVMMKGCLAISLISTVLLGSCDRYHDYRVLAVITHGRLAFIVDPASTDQESCVESIHVSADKAERATAEPAPGDDPQLVANGVFWWKDLARVCVDHFPVIYGQPLKGQQRVYTGNVPGMPRGRKSSVVEAKPLKLGLVYEVQTSSGILRNGHGRFAIDNKGHVENLPSADTAA